MIRLIIISIMLIFISTAFAGENWQIESYDKAQSLFDSLDKKEAELLQRIEPEVAGFYAVWIPYREAINKMNRYAFLRQLEQDPKAINWTNVWDWSGGTYEQEKLAIIDPDFKQLRDDFLQKKEAFKAAKHFTRMRNELYKENSDACNKLEENLLYELKLLQAEVNTKRANQEDAPEPKAVR